MPDVTTGMVNAALDSWWADVLLGASDTVRDELKARSQDRMRNALQAAMEARQDYNDRIYGHHA